MNEQQQQSLQSQLVSFYKQPFEWVNFSKSVIEWNKFFRGGNHDYSDQVFHKQQELVFEEYNEVKAAIASGLRSEIVKELIDLVVVSSYNMFLCGWIEDHDYKPNPFYNRTIEAMDCFVYGYEHNECSLPSTEFYQFAISELNKIGDFEAYANGILAANWTKIPTIEDFIATTVRKSWTLDMFDSDPLSCPLDAAIKEQIVALEADKRYNSVKASVIQDHIIFRDGTGKLLKPCTFVEFNI